MVEIKTVDIIIPTYRPGETFLRLFAMLQKQTLQYNRLIVINTEAGLMKDEIRRRLLEEPRTILKDITAEEFDHAATRMMGVGLSQADAFICMTDDAVPEDIYLIEQLVHSLQEEDVAIAYARQVAAKNADESEKYIRIFNYPDKNAKKTINDVERLGIKTFFASDVCCAYKRKVFDQIGGFTEHAIFNEDMVFAAAALKAGYASVYNAGAKVIHSHNYTAMQQFHRNFDLGVSQAMHPEVFSGLKSEGEGIKLVKNTIKHLAGSGHVADIPVFIVRTAFRYAGYRAGKKYNVLPYKMAEAFAMNKTYMRKHIK